MADGIVSVLDGSTFVVGDRHGDVRIDGGAALGDAPG
jgi:hypothetical protein